MDQDQIDYWHRLCDQATLGPYARETVIAVMFAIQSGKFPLPWPQHYVENIGDNPHAVVDLALMAPDFVRQAVMFYFAQ